MDRMADHIVSLNIEEPLWERFFMIAPLVLIGTREFNGTNNLAPKHMVMPMGWSNMFGFMCAPAHMTYKNIVRNGSFSVCFPRASQVVTASLAAEPRTDDDVKPGLTSLPTIPSPLVEGCFLKDSYLFLECKTERIVDGFGDNSLVVGNVIGAYVNEDALRITEKEDEEVVDQSQILGYVSPGRYCTIKETFNFPFPAGFRQQ